MTKWQNIKDLVLDFLFPKFCVGCTKENSPISHDRSATPGGGWVCDECAQKIIPVASQICPECGRLSEQGRYHAKCAKGKFLKGILAAAYFEEGPIRETIHNFKYNGVIALAEPLAELMISALARNFQIPITNNQSNPNNQIKKLKIDNSLEIGNLDFVITFVPLHWRRQAQRGYNQAEILAKIVGKKSGLDVCNLLTKKRSTKRQAELTGSNRRANLSDVFIMKSNVDIKNKKIVIIDDVTTTGSTLNECARVLRLAGAKEVWGLVVSRG